MALLLLGAAGCSTTDEPGRTAQQVDGSTESGDAAGACPGSSDALPTGACPSRGSACSVALSESCPDGTSGPTRYYVCTCGSEWACRETGTVFGDVCGSSSDAGP